MNRSICLFEDEKWTDLNPLASFIPIYELRCGILTLKEKVEKHFASDKVLIHARRYLTETIIGQLYNNILFDPNYSEEWLFINGRIIADEQLVKVLNGITEETVFTNNGMVIAAYLKSGNLKNIMQNAPEFPDFSKLTNIPIKHLGTKYIAFPWDLIKFNGEEILNDFKLLKADLSPNLRNYEGVVCRNKGQIHIGNYCEIEPFVFLNADKGPIYIDDHVKIYSHCSIEGPVFIGHNSMIKTHSSIYKNTSIGGVSKIGGEVENSIIHSYTNKQHYGFLGHSYLGQWINLGAGTTNSDLKNNYSPVRVNHNGKEIDTGMTFLGSMIGDYTKTAIGTTLNTGSIIGACCNILSEKTAPKYIPPFSWVNCENYSEYAFDKIIETTKLVYSRRGIIFTDSDSRLFSEVFKHAKSQKSV